jgi:hypothetical protein
MVRALVTRKPDVMQLPGTQDAGQWWPLAGPGIFLKNLLYAI